MPDATPPVRMVCFDAGGVLVRICRSWREGCMAAGVEVRWNEEAEAGEVARQEASALYQRGRMPEADFFEAVSRSTGGLYAPGEVRAVHEAWILGEYTDAASLVGGINRAPGLTTGLLSNTNASHWAQRHMLGGRGVSAVGSVEHPHASHLLGLLKPEEEIYRAFERATGFAGREILFFDDLPENVEAARRAGWRAERIDHSAETAGQIIGVLRAHGLPV